MKLISLEDYSKINEAVIGLRNLITPEEFKQLKEEEQRNIIKLLLLNSGDGTGLFESLDAINHSLSTEGYKINTSITESINESVNEGWDDDVSKGIAAAGAGAVGGVATLAAYISFLFKKKKIRKAWDEVKKIQLAKIDKDVQAYEEESDLKAKVAKDEFEQFKEDKEKEIKNLESEKAEKTGPNAADDLKQQINALKVELAGLDPVTHPPSDNDSEQESTEESDEDKEKAKKAAAAKAKMDKEAAGAKAKIEGDVDKNKKKMQGESLKEADEENKDNTESKESRSGENSSNEKGEKQIAKEKLDQAIEAEEETLAKEKEKISAAKKANSEQRQKIKDGSGTTDQKNKKLEKLSKDDQKLSDQSKELEEKGSKEKQKAANEYEKIKQDILNKEEELAALQKDKQNILDPAQKAKVAKEYDDKIKALRDDITEKEKETRPDPQAGAKKEIIKKQLERDVEQLNKEQESAEEDARRISGVDKDGKATGLGGKVLGFSASYASEIKAANRKEVLQAEKDALLQKASIDQQQIDSLSKDSGKKKEEDAANIDNEIANAEEREKNAQNNLENEVNSVDASDDEIKKAEDGVKKEQDKIEAREAEEKKDQADAKKDAISKQIEKHEKNIESLKKEVASKGGKKKEEAQYKLDQAKKKLEGAKEQYSKLGESFSLNFQLAVIEREINSIMSEYNLILEGTRKELIPEEDEKGEKAKDDIEKDKKDEDGDGQKDPADVAKDIKKKSEEKDKNNPLIGKKVVLKNMRDKDLGQLEGATGEVVKSFEENEREPEGDLPRRIGDPEVYKIKFDKPKDPMYPEINLTKDHFEEAPEKKEKEEKTEESIADKFRNALNESKLNDLKKLEQKIYDSREKGAIDLWEDYSERANGINGNWDDAPEQSYPKAIRELEDICTKYRIK